MLYFNRHIATSILYFNTFVLYDTSGWCQLSRTTITPTPTSDRLFSLVFLFWDTRNCENGKVELIFNNNHCKIAEVRISLLLSHQYWSSDLPCSRLLSSSHLLRGGILFFLRARSDITYNWCLSFVISHYTQFSFDVVRNSRSGLTAAFVLWCYLLHKFILFVQYNQVNALSYFLLQIYKNIKILVAM